MRVHIFQHVDFEGAGFIQTYLQNKHSLHVTELHHRQSLPKLTEVDALIILGGPMSVNDTSVFSWLKDEQEFARQFANTGKPMLGICLGAQTIAKAFGGAIYKSQEKEIGWWLIHNTATQSDVFQFPKRMEAFHWHGETFSLPEHAVRLASSAACENQAFQIGRRIMGLQFHLEATPQSAQDLIIHCPDELVSGKPYIQSAATLQSINPERYQTLNVLMAQVLDYLLN